ncbi:hypothetical protein [Allocoleopsis sp.]|uniref:hypothetical protein n=1 Tax=Allocoleopsis sp. TaxID=3088169 RepID=UPI002FD587A5
MRIKINLTHILILAVLFISFGDRVLPQPMSRASTQTRDSVNQLFNQIFPKVQPGNPTN